MQDWLLDLLQTNDLNQAISALSFTSVATAVVLLVILVALAAFLRDRFPASKPWLFWSMATIVLVVTFILIGSTVYLNTVSTSGGPVHRHADFEMWACGEELELEDPSEFLSNKIGTPVLHEHNDKRIHLEGVVVEPRDGSLGKFMKVTGGSITRNSIVFPTNDGGRSFINGETCQGRPSELQVFVYQTTENGYYTLRKLENPPEYTISDESVVPPGDCIIMEFAPPKQTTSKMCRQYEVALDIGDLKGRAPE